MCLSGIEPSWFAAAKTGSSPASVQGCATGLCLQIDLLVEDNLVVKLKAVERVPRIATVQLLTYLRLMIVALGY
jgi:GxxExxY protein